MKKTALTIAFLAVAALSITTTVSADIIFDADTTNTTLIGNGIGGDGTLSGTAGSLTFQNSGGNFNFSGFASTEDINTLNGTPITDLDTVTISVIVDEFNGAELRSNGVDFGLNDAAANPNSNAEPGDLIIRTEASNSGGDIIVFVDEGSSEPDNTVNASTVELTNGFTSTLVADVNGYTFTLDSVGPTSPLTFSGTFAPGEFVSIVGGGHFAFTQQHRNNAQAASPGNLTSTISQARIEVVTAIPEPGSLALIGIATLGLCGVRRRR